MRAIELLTGERKPPLVIAQLLHAYYRAVQGVIVSPLGVTYVLCRCKDLHSYSGLFVYYETYSRRHLLPNSRVATIPDEPGKVQIGCSCSFSFFTCADGHREGFAREPLSCS